ncbi:MAG: amino acid adenylation domain-containing protein, partial [Bacillota bacterium]
MSTKKLDKKNIEDILALTPMQEGILFHYLSNPKSKQYFEQLSLRLTGSVDMDVLRKAWNFVAKTNEILRNVFRWEKLEKPVQIILREYEIPIREHDFSALQRDEGLERLDDIKSKDRDENIDISTEPFRITLCKLEQDRYEMVVSSHHILYDGWSNAILLKEFLEAYHTFYEGQEPVRPVKNRYREFVKWHQSRDLEIQKSYWKEYLQGFESKTLLPYDRKKQGDIKEAEVYTYTFDRDAAERIKDFARQRKVTTASILYAAWGVLLQRYNSTDDVVFGTTVSGRTAKIKDIENIAGLFINTPPLRIRLESGQCVSGLLNEIERSLRERGQFEDTPLTDIKACSSMDSKETLFDSIMVIENYPLDKQLSSDGSHIKIESFSMFEMTNFDIAVAVSVFEGVEVKFVYNGDIFYPETIERMSGHLINIINCMIGNPNIDVSKIDILSSAERDWLLQTYNNTTSLYPRDKTLSQLFEEQVRRVPDNTALVFEGVELTYRELNEEANRFARFLRKKGVEAESIVGLLMERSFGMIIAILGILKAGGAYLPIDPDYPFERVDSIISDSGAGHLVTNMELSRKLLPGGNGSLEGSSAQILLMDGPDSDFSRESIQDIECINLPSSPAYVMYTSGSTGMPKGTLTTHYNISRVVKNTNYIDITDKDILLQLSNYAFDGSTFDIFGALLNGAKLVLVNRQTILDIIGLSNLIRNEKITVFFVTTALFNTLADLNVECFENVRKVLFGGERVSVPHVRKVLDHVGPGRVIHVYGPTESTVFASYHFVDRVDEEAATIPIGKPLSNTQIYIVDKNNNLQPFGAQGELCIAGDGLAKGYLNRPELTVEKFVPNPFVVKSGQETWDNGNQREDNRKLMYRTGDLARWLPDGSIEFLDRIDTQVKLRGFRIELGEIESQLLEYEGVKEAVVFAREDKEGNKYLCAYFTSQSEIALSGLRERLLGKLPAYMVPSSFVRLEKMPLNSNGKINKKALPEPETNEVKGKNYIAPGGETEEKLAKLWQEVLGTQRVGAKDNFFELGGHSLKATVLASRIHKELNKSVPLAQILNTQNLRELAGYIDGAEKNIYSQIKPVEENQDYIKGTYPKGVYPASSSQKRMFVQQQFEGIGTSYNMPLAMTIEGGLNPVRAKEILESLVMRHEPLRTSFEIYNGEIVQRVHKDVNFKITCLEYGGENADSILKELIRPFDLDKAPLIRAAVVKVQEGRHILLLDMHHIISDGVSIAVLVKEFEDLYNGKRLPDLSIQYKDFSYWYNKLLEGPSMKKQEEYWVNVLDGEIPVLNMPSDFNRSDNRTFDGDIVEFSFGDETSSLLHTLAKKHGVTLNTLLLSLYTALLYRYTGQQDISVGSLVAGRNHPDVENMMGMFNNFLPIRNRFDPDSTFAELLDCVSSTVLRAYENQDYPYDKMVEKLAGRTERSRNPFFDTMLILHNELEQDISPVIHGLSFNMYKLNSCTSKLDFKLDVYLNKSGCMECTLEYNTGLFRKETIERLAKHFINIVDEIIQRPCKKISEIEMLTEEEKNQILFDFNNTKAGYPMDKTIPRVFEEQVERMPH